MIASCEQAHLKKVETFHLKIFAKAEINIENFSGKKSRKRFKSKKSASLMMKVFVSKLYLRIGCMKLKLEVDTNKESLIPKS